MLAAKVHHEERSIVSVVKPTMRQRRRTKPTVCCAHCDPRQRCAQRLAGSGETGKHLFHVQTRHSSSSLGIDLRGGFLKSKYTKVCADSDLGLNIAATL